MKHLISFQPPQWNLSRDASQVSWVVKGFCETSRKNVLFLMDTKSSARYYVLTFLDEDDSTSTPNMSSYESQVSTVQVNFVNH